MKTRLVFPNVITSRGKKNIVTLLKHHVLTVNTKRMLSSFILGCDLMPLLSMAALCKTKLGFFFSWLHSFSLHIRARSLMFAFMCQEVWTAEHKY